MYKVFYWLMLVGYLGVSIQSIGFRNKILGILLLAVNALIFYRR